MYKKWRLSLLAEALFFIRKDSSSLIFAVVTETIKIGDIFEKF